MTNAFLGILSLGKNNTKWIIRIVFSKIIINVVFYIFCERLASFFTNQSSFTTNQIFFLVILSTLYACGTFVLQDAYAKSSCTVKSYVRKIVFEKLLELEVRYTKYQKTGALVTVMVEGVRKFELFFSFFWPQCFVLMINPIVISLYYYFFISKTIFLILFIFFLAVPFACGALSSMLMKSTTKSFTKYIDLNARLLDNIRGLLTIKNYGLDDIRTKQLANEAETFRVKVMNVLYAQLLTVVIMDILNMIGSAVAIYYCITYFIQGNLNLYEAAIVCLTAYEYFVELRVGVAFFMYVMESFSNVKYLLPILHHHETCNYPKVENGEKIRKKMKNFDVKFSNVKFAYNKKGKTILNGISFTAKQGDVIAIVGESGEGKSTISNLLGCFYKPQSGTINIGGIGLNELGSNEVRKLISEVSQSTFLFYGTIRENLLIAKPNATTDELFSACKKAGIADFICSLPKKLDSPLKEYANNLSCGEMQRIALARAILKDSPILILDEATSYVDNSNEKFIQEQFFKLSKSKTTIMIAHRLSTIERANKILVLKGGKVAESGTLSELLNMNGLFKRMYDFQMKYESIAKKQNSKVMDMFSKSELENETFGKNVLINLSTTSKKKLQKKHARMGRLILLWNLTKAVKKYLIPKVFAVTFGIMGYLGISFLPSYSLYILFNSFQNDIKITFFQWAFLFSFSLWKAIGAYVEQLANHYTAFKVLASIRTKFFRTLIKLFPSSYQILDFRAGDLISRSGHDIELLEIFFAHTISPFIICIIIMFMYTIILYFIHPLSALICFISHAFIAFIVPYIYEKITRKLGRDIRIMQGNLNAFLTDSLQGLRTILLFNRGVERKNKLMENEKEFSQLRMKHAWREAILNSCLYFVKFITSTIVIYFCLNDYYNSRIEIQIAVIAIALVMTSYEPILAVGRVASNLTETFASIERVLNVTGKDITDKKDEYQEVEVNVNHENAIEFKNVNFGYEEGNEVLNNVNMVIKKGRSVAIVGSSGQGKSTIFNLISKHWNLNKSNGGDIKIFGRSIKDIPAKQIAQKLVTVVAQRTYIFNETIKENIQIGKFEKGKKPTMEEIIQSAKSSNIHNFIDSLPEKYDTMPGELGDKISGGERQRIDLSRAYLKDSPILLLDESTSNLDNLNEHQVLEIISENSKKNNRTTIFVTHRLSVLNYVDDIYQIKGGTIKKISSKNIEY